MYKKNMGSFLNQIHQQVHQTCWYIWLKNDPIYSSSTGLFWSEECNCLGIKGFQPNFSL